MQVVADGRAALERARSTELDLIVLDVMLPLVDGLDVCRILRAEGYGIPILLLTARSTEEDMLLGLDPGADDYLTLADGRTFTLDLDELPRPEPEADAR